MTATGNLLEHGGPPSVGSLRETVHRAKNVVFERVVASATPDDREREKDVDEWMLAVAGRLVVEVGGVRQTLEPGGWLHLPARTPHRLVETEKASVWVVVRIHPTEGLGA